VMLPLALLVPAFAYQNHASEQLFARRWARQIVPPRRRRRSRGGSLGRALRPAGVEKTS
jgi:hypothetical protein